MLPAFFRPIRRRMLCALALSVSTAGLCAARDRAAGPAQPMIACRVLETMTSRELQMRLAIFHSRDASDRQRLGELLRQHDGETIEFQSDDGQWHAATLLRLRTCFGRGLVIFPASEGQLAEKQDFLLRFPEPK